MQWMEGMERCEGSVQRMEGLEGMEGLQRMEEGMVMLVDGGLFLRQGLMPF